jgi:multiple sugar transport system substrate-binding protein
MSKHLVFAITLIAARLFAGCEKSETAGHRIRLVMTIVSAPADQPKFQAAVDRFLAKRPDVEVELLPISGNYYHKVLVMIAGRNAPDLMWMGGGFGEFAEHGALLDVSSRVAADVDTSRFVPQTLEWYKFRGKQYGVPFGIDTQFILYNRKLFDAAKLPYPTNDWDYDEFLRDAHALTKDIDGDGRTERFGFSGELDPTTFGAEYLAPDGSRALCNSPAMIDYLRTNYDLIHKERVAILGKGGGEATIDDVMTLFRQGRVAMALMFTWDLPFLREKLADMDWDIVTNPKVRTRAHWASSRAVVISADTPHPDEAWQLCREFFGEEFQRAMSDTVVPSDVRVGAEMIARHTGRPRNVLALVDAARTGHVVPRVPNVTELMQLWNDARDRVRDGRATPQQAMADAEAAIDRMIKRRHPGAAP